MIGLDYFLDDKWIKKQTSKLKTNTFYSTLPSKEGPKFNWSFQKAVDDDRFLYDYINGFKVDIMNKVYREFRYYDIISILFVDGNLQGKSSFKTLYKELTDINNDTVKPNSYDERLMQNMLKVYDLIYQNNFPLNEENFELIVHILFRNLGYDMDRKENIKRSEKTKSKFKNLLDPSLIDQELENFWAFIKANSTNNFSGFTEALILGLEFLYISPYNQLNIILMQFIIKWYLFQLDQEFSFMNSSILIALNFNQFVKTVDKVFATNFNTDEYLELTKTLVKDQTNLTKRYLWLKENKYIPEGYEKEFSDQNLELLLAFIMRNNAETFNLDEMIDRNCFIDGVYCTKEEVETEIALLVGANVLSKTKENNKNVYAWKDKHFKKIANLLKD
ncbi:hypothetical protein [Mesoplasma lactucae]|uniref:Uncharacterized protein n=1 Tax=Mesoplasma lactucae ATCC 49193 TaxID=81460 RepID=A0A291ISD2_9MOLU|nr:hypothetical protein [Mesoplasma lactucae]ATG97660.1 hypothetical protein CP520_02890 [Mesoplasma lactucae ATCC 49193]ATZ19875.1 hypothetical protein MLACT_v1c00500 [Mesoplasma lactucae ATCC 49193]MCL8216738.1 hypothetical protein [Mesoplasma lactucae ATCC 49193]